MKCLVFDIWGDFAHYRKFYTTSSPLTFSVPPRTAICGMIGAIVGIDKEEYLKQFTKDKAKIALSIRKPVKKTRVSYNLIDTKTAKMMRIIENRTQVTFELLKDCQFRVYFNHQDENIYNELKESLIEHRSFYTPCLGLSEFLANFQYIGEFDLKEIQGEGFNKIDSIVPFNENLKVQFENDAEYFKDTMPNEMNEQREVLEYVKVIYERNCRTVECNIDKYYECGDEKIVFL